MLKHKSRGSVSQHAKKPVLKSRATRTIKRHISNHNDFEQDSLPSPNAPKPKIRSKSGGFIKQATIDSIHQQKTNNMAHTDTFKLLNQDDHGINGDIDSLTRTSSSFDVVEQQIKAKSPLTPLVQDLRQQIMVRGPLSMSEYIQFCLGHPQHGYYMQRNAIGKAGDFVTSPEISPVFSEMLGIWAMASWMRMGRPQNVQLIELGPGRGTLMRDMITAIERFPEFYNAISIHFVENSIPMRKLQRNALDVVLDLPVISTIDANTTYHNNTIDQEGLLLDKVHNILSQHTTLRDKLLKHAQEIRDDTTTTTQKTSSDTATKKRLSLSLDDLDQDTRESLIALETQLFREIKGINPVDTTSPTSVSMSNTTYNRSSSFLNNWVKLGSGKLNVSDVASLFSSPYDKSTDDDGTNTLNRSVLPTKDDIDRYNKHGDNVYTLNPDIKSQLFDKHIGLPVVHGKTRTKFDNTRSDIATTIHRDGKEIKQLPSKRHLLKDSIDVSWHWTLTDTPHTAPCILFAHEFFDALPVHQFQYTSRGWREILIDIDDSLTGPHHLRYVLSPRETPASRSFVANMYADVDTVTTPLSESLSDVSNPNITPIGATGTMLGNTTQITDIDGNVIGKTTISSLDEEKRLSGIQNSPSVREKLLSPAQIGDTFEVSPISMIWAEHIALRLLRSGGAALMIDYGDNDLGHLTSIDQLHAMKEKNINIYGIDMKQRAYRELSVQGIKDHHQADILSEPGLVDISAHVNFGSIGQAFYKTQNLVDNVLRQGKDSSQIYNKLCNLLKLKQDEMSTFTPHKLHIKQAITQSSLLQQLGIEQRFETLLANCTNDDDAQRLYDSINRLVDPSQMGELFKAMTVYTDMVSPPPGWDYKDTFDDSKIVPGLVLDAKDNESGGIAGQVKPHQQQHQQVSPPRDPSLYKEVERNV